MLCAHGPPRELRRAVLLLAVAAGLLGGCEGAKNEEDPGSAAIPPSPPAPTFQATVLVVDEGGQPVAGATVEVPLVPAATVATGNDGRATLSDLDDPALLIVQASGFLPEPAVLGREQADSEVRVRLFAESGPTGRSRVVLHFAGDTMFGRRFVDPEEEGTAVITPGDGGESAREVVRDIAPLYAAAHVRSLNLETVVGALPAALEYPGKLFIIQSPPEAIEALDELGANLVTLGNNHTRDLLDAGVQSTISHLDGAGIPHVGAGLDEASARVPRLIDAPGHRIAFLSYTSINGDSNNDRLPDAGDPIPPGTSREDLWKYERRRFEFHGHGVDIPAANRRIKEVWELFVAAEPAIATDQGRADLWQAASAVYPELQDWVARRGHGGANLLVVSRLEADIAALRAAGHDLVVVEFHSGFQYVDAKSAGTRNAAHRAIDAGADLVVGHHSHILQGLEWYKGKLIFYSLGNFVFDQDLLFTFPSAILRTVFEGGILIEARVYPITIENYRPVAVTGSAAESTLRNLQEMSSISAQSERVGGIILQVRLDPEADSEVPRFVRDGNSALVTRAARAPRLVAADIFPGQATTLGQGGLVLAGAPLGGPLGDVLFGRDIFTWGDFEDVAGDRVSRGGLHWVVGESFKRVEVLEPSPSGVRCLRLERHAGNSSRVLARARARVNMREHRLYEQLPDGSVTPLDGDPAYSVRFVARLEGNGTPFLQFDVYNFQDEIPLSTFFRQSVAEFEVETDGAWHEVLFDIPPPVLADAHGLDANAVLFYVGLMPPAAGRSALFVDDLQFIEWRRADDLYPVHYRVDVLRAAAGGAGSTVILEVVE